MKEFILRVETLDWGLQEAQAYAELKTYLESQGKVLGVMDMLIAAHAYAVRATLVTNDNAFWFLENKLTLQNWSKA